MIWGAMLILARSSSKENWFWGIKQIGLGQLMMPWEKTTRCIPCELWLCIFLSTSKTHTSHDNSC